jgi:hypothetical protein
MEWKIAVQDEVLRGELFLNDNDYGPVNAWSLVESLPKSRLTLACQHKPIEPAGVIGNEYVLKIGSVGSGHDSPRRLIDVGRSYAKQLACLRQQGFYPPTVVHVDGCVGCALRLCSDGPSRLVIS